MASFPFLNFTFVSADGIDSSSSSSSSRGNDDGAEFPFYTPKSKEPATFHHGKGRPYSSPWNDTARESLRTSFHFQPEHNWMNGIHIQAYTYICTMA